MSDDVRSKPDAVLVPKDYRRTGEPVGDIQALNAEFAPILDVPRLYWSDVGGVKRFGYATPPQTILFPIEHLKEKQPRYDWIDRGDGVEFGYLKPDA